MKQPTAEDNEQYPPVSDEDLSQYADLYYKDLLDEEASWDTAEQIRSMARELIRRRAADVKETP